MVRDTLAEAESLGTPRAIALCRNFGGLLAFQDGRWDEAERWLQEAVATYRRLGSASGEASSLHRLATVLTARGDVDGGLRALGESLAPGDRATLRAHLMTRVFAYLARNRLAAGDLEAADGYLARGQEAVAEHGRCVTCSALHLPEAVRVHLAHGRTGPALAAVAELEAIAEEYRSRAWVGMARAARGRYLLAVGDRAGARAILELAEHAYSACGDAYEAARCLALRAAAEDDAEHAEALVRQARATLAGLGCASFEDDAVEAARAGAAAAG